MQRSKRGRVFGKESRGAARAVRETPQHSLPPEVYLPKESEGTCRGVKTCNNWRVPLANGWCDYHWDRGLDL